MNDRVRIHKALADVGVASRRKAEELVKNGRVTVNGEPAGVGQRVDPARDSLEVDGKPVGQDRQRRLYLVMAKPAGVTSTVRDRHAKRTVLELVPAALRHEAARLYPVGRLDRESEGLLLLTNDGDWAQRMLHPSHGVEREYAVAVDVALDSAQRSQLEIGIEVEEGTARLVGLRQQTAVETRRLAGSDFGERLAWYRVTLRQGLKRQVRRMFAAVGVPVRRLIRVRVGTVMLGDMKAGDVRPLSAVERRDLERLSFDEPASDGGLVVTIDGPGGSGKSTVGAKAAEQLGYRFCDTGVLYRGLTWLAMQRGVPSSDADGLVALVPSMELAPDEQGRYVRLLAHRREVTDELHTAEVDREVSNVSQHAAVRAALLPVQRALAAPRRIIMAGRDIGSVVLPEADLKLYLDVSVEERARRRAHERGVEDDPSAADRIARELRKRDEIDSTRSASPLRVPAGATRVQTDGNTLDQTVAQVVEIIRKIEGSQPDGE